MIIELTLENIDLIEKSFLNKDTVLHELEYNSFGKYLLYIEDNEVQGYLYYSDIYERCEINQFEVNTKFRNFGKGSKLLESLIKIADKNKQNITLEVKIDNYPAINLYKKYGFVEKTIRKGYYKGIDGILMERERKSE